MALLGFSSPFVFVPLISEIIDAVREKEGIPESPFLNDKASGLYNGAYGVGTFLAPLIGSALFEAVGFRSTTDIMSLCSFVLFFVHFSCSILP